MMGSLMEAGSCFLFAERSAASTPHVVDHRRSRGAGLRSRPADRRARGRDLKATTEDRATRRVAPVGCCFSCAGSTLARRGPDVRGAAPRGGEPLRCSAAEAEALDDGAVALDLRLLQVVEQAAALADQEQQATTAVVDVLVRLEVLGEVRDAVAEQRDLDLRRTGVTLGQGVLGDDLLLGLRVGTNRHGGSFGSRCAARPGLFTGALWFRGRRDGVSPSWATG